VALLSLVDLFDLPPVRALFVLTFPWLVDHRPRMVVALFASVLVAGGSVAALAGLGRLRERLRPGVWRRIAVACALLGLFFAEGSAVSVYKRVAQTVDEQNVYSADDRAAMAWLRQNAQPGEVLGNDNFRDAATWAPYKAGLPILLPRSGSPDAEQRQEVLARVGELSSAPGALHEACALGLKYIYLGGRVLPVDPPLIPSRTRLEQSPELQNVFSSGAATIFRLNLACD
jgi:hypothetical protein